LAPVNLGQMAIDATLGYARLYDRTLAEDYFAAMEQVEKRPEAEPRKVGDDAHPRGNDNERAEILIPATQLAEPDLGIQLRLELVDQLCRELNCTMQPEEKRPTEEANGRGPRPPP
jgi:hypothetical protein